jgi:hypothetical protein
MLNCGGAVRTPVLGQPCGRPGGAGVPEQGERLAHPPVPRTWSDPPAVARSTRTVSAPGAEAPPMSPGALGEVDEIERPLGDLDPRLHASLVGDELAQDREVVVKTQPPGFPHGQRPSRLERGEGCGRLPGPELQVVDRGLAVGWPR